ncbi:M20/M25/M40 family metallo-hydrolase [bacterium LRH843]|nr:M20/M25/M40 family metallo-hydrolase [bacterium LRH843]
MLGQWGTMSEMLRLLKRIVRIDSIVGTDGEKRMGEELVRILKEHSYFRSSKERIVTIPIPNDPLKRFGVAAIYQGEKINRKAFVLLSHFDVVGVEDVGRNKSFIFDIDRYASALLREEIPMKVREQLESGDWIAGRGVMDMKAGLVVQLAVLGHIIEKEIPVNIILLAVPDEERNSEGMLQAVEWLANWKEAERVDEIIGICSEPSFSSYPGDESNYIYKGSIGKMLPLICAIGLETHVGEPLAGVNASWMMAELVSEIELSPVFQENVDGERTPLPTCLKLSDTKSNYDVQTATFAYTYVNVLLIKQTVENVLNKVKQAASISAERTHQRLLRRFKEEGINKRTPVKPAVYLYSELLEEAKVLYGKEVERVLHEVEVKCTGQDSRDLSVSLAYTLTSFFKARAPFYLILVAPPFYPSVQLCQSNKLEQRMMEEIKELIKWAQEEFGETITEKAYFGGLSDVSYSRLANAEMTRTMLTGEMPALGKGYQLPLDAIKRLDMSTVNIGPYGEDAHKWTERLFVPYFTNVTPNLINKFIEKMM